MISVKYMLESVFGNLSSSQLSCLLMGTVMLLIIASCVLIWQTDVYRLLPGWGPIRKFEASGNEDMRVRQLQINSHAIKVEASRVKEAPAVQPSWGVCESADHTATPFIHPVYGACKLREGFAETQKLRAECEWWAKDERHFMAEKGVYRKAPMNEDFVGNHFCMV